MSGNWEYLDAMLVIGPVAGLFLLGLFITLRSGVVDMATRKGLRLAAGNFSWMLFRILGYLAGLLAVQRMIGAPTNLGW